MAAIFRGCWREKLVLVFVFSFKTTNCEKLMYGVQLVMTRTSIDGEGREDVLACNEGKCADGKIAGILSTKLPTFPCQKYSALVGLK